MITTAPTPGCRQRGSVPYSKECSGPGRCRCGRRRRTPGPPAAARPRRSAYFFTNFGTRPPLSPAMSGQTSTWASQSTPAPMPMVGMDSSSVTCAAIVGGHHLQDDGERAGLLHGAGVGEQLLGARAAALHPVAAEGVLALRREADVRHHRDAGVVQQPDLRRDPHAALELDRLRAALLHQPDGGVERLLRAGLVAAERHVGDDQRPRRRAGDRLGEQQDVLDRHRHGAGVPEDDVARRVARPASPGCRPPRRSRRCRCRRR